MNWPGHFGIALLLYAPVAYLLLRRGRGRWAWLGTAGLLALASSPDLDLYVETLAHRGITHTVWAVLAGGVVLAVFAVLCRPLVAGTTRSLAGFGFLVGTLSVAGHLLGDVATPMGVRPMYPVAVNEHTLQLVAASNAEVNGGLFICGVVAFVTALAEARLQESGERATDDDLQRIRAPE